MQTQSIYSPHENACIIGFSVAILVGSGCADHNAEAREEAKAHSEAAHKEMDARPKAFKTPPFFKVNEAEKKTEPAVSHKKTNP